MASFVSGIVSGAKKWISLPLAVTLGGSGQSVYTSGQILIGNVAGGLTKTTITIVANQTVITNGDGAITIGTVQDIGTASNVQHGKLGLGVVPTYVLDVVGAPAAVNGSQIIKAPTATGAGTDAALRLTTTVNPASASSASFTSFYNTAASNAACAQNLTTVQGSAYEAYHYGAGTLGTLRGLGINVFGQTSSGTITTRNGLMIVMGSIAGTTSTNVNGISVTASEAGTVSTSWDGVIVSAPSLIGKSRGIVATNNGNAFVATHSNTAYRSSLGFSSGGANPFLGLHSEHSTTASTLRNDGSGFKGFSFWHDQAGTASIACQWNSVATANADFTAIVTPLNLNSDGTISTGIVNKYNGILTVSNGVAAEYATVDLTAQTANIAAATLYAVPSTGAGMYRVSAYVVLTTAASVSSTLPNVQIVFTDNQTNTSITIDATPVLGVAGIGQTGALTANTVGTAASGVIVVNAKASTNIQYQLVNYQSSLACMAYAIHIKLEAM
jgi:hypothetical protein